MPGSTGAGLLTGLTGASASGEGPETWACVDGAGSWAHGSQPSTGTTGIGLHLGMRASPALEGTWVMMSVELAWRWGKPGAWVGVSLQPG